MNHFQNLAFWSTWGGTCAWMQHTSMAFFVVTGQVNLKKKKFIYFFLSFWISEVNLHWMCHCVHGWIWKSETRQRYSIIQRNYKFKSKLSDFLKIHLQMAVELSFIWNSEINAIQKYSGQTFNSWPKRKCWSGEKQTPLTQAVALQNPSCLQIICKFNAAKHSVRSLYMYLCIVLESVQWKYY